MRIHGEVKIKRRESVIQKSDYCEYNEILSEDFGHICGYCGKSEMVTTKGFEIDHFVPDNIDSSRETDYYNLVYSCFTCNRKKTGKWPTKNKDVYFDDTAGFVDPATDEYDIHLERDLSGTIIANTAVGKYMCENVFKFNKRPIKEIWKYMQILKKKELLASRKNILSADEFLIYIDLDTKITELHKYLFKKKE